jgi:hypothetical protein
VKKTLATILSLTILTVLFSGCGKQEQKQDQYTKARNQFAEKANIQKFATLVTNYKNTHKGVYPSNLKMLYPKLNFNSTTDKSSILNKIIYLKPNFVDKNYSQAFDITRTEKPVPKVAIAADNYGNILFANGEINHFKGDNWIKNAKNIQLETLWNNKF